MCKVCNYSGRLMPTGEVYKENKIRYRQVICPWCDSIEFEQIVEKQKTNCFLNFSAASITVMSIFIGTFYIFSHLDKFTTIFTK